MANAERKRERSEKRYGFVSYCIAKSKLLSPIPARRSITYPHSEFCETPSSATRHQSGLHKQTRSLGSKHSYYIGKSEISRSLQSCREHISIETLPNGACETKKNKTKQNKGGKDSIARPNQAKASICKLSSLTGLVRIVSTIAIRIRRAARRRPSFTTTTHIPT